MDHLKPVALVRKDRKREHLEDRGIDKIGTLDPVIFLIVPEIARPEVIAESDGIQNFRKLVLQ